MAASPQPETQTLPKERARNVMTEPSIRALCHRSNQVAVASATKSRRRVRPKGTRDLTGEAATVQTVPSVRLSEDRFMS